MKITKKNSIAKGVYLTPFPLCTSATKIGMEHARVAWLILRELGVSAIVQTPPYFL